MVIQRFFFREYSLKPRKRVHPGENKILDI